VGVGGAPLAMLLRLDVELLRLPGPDTQRTVKNHTELLMLFLQAKLYREHVTNMMTVHVMMDRAGNTCKAWCDAY
jgi:hypothetical protein